MKSTQGEHQVVKSFFLRPVLANFIPRARSTPIYLSSDPVPMDLIRPDGESNRETDQELEQELEQKPANSVPLLT